MQALGYAWYVFVESFGSLFPALFWAFITDTTEPISAKRGFPLVVAIGQIGGVFCPYGIGVLPHRLGLTTDSLSMMILGIMTLMLIPLVKNFLKSTPKHLMTSFVEEISDPKAHKSEPGFLEGFRLLRVHKYLIVMFSVQFIYEFTITIFDFNFKVAASTIFSGVALSNYLSIYASSVNSFSLLCLLLEISNITRYLGVGIALTAMPIVVGLALIGFMTPDSLTFLFSLMVGSKAINCANFKAIICTNNNGYAL